MTMYRLKPVEVEARCYDSAFTAQPIVDWINASGGKARYARALEVIQISILGGALTADRGDWIIRGVKGEFYPCKPDIFAATYEEVQP